MIAYQELIAILQTVFSDSLLIIFLAGSQAWVEKNKKQDDFDLELIIADNFHINEQINNSRFTICQKRDLSNFLLFAGNFMKLYFERKADYASHKIWTSQGKFSIHLVPQKIFKRVCTLDLINLQRTITLREYRLIPKEKYPIYYQRNFKGQVTNFNCKVKLIDEGRITLTPLAIMRNGVYHLGLLPDKYLTGEMIFLADKAFLQFRERLITNLLLRLKKEREIYPKSRLSLASSCFNYKKLPKFLIRELEKREHDFFNS